MRSIAVLAIAIAAVVSAVKVDTKDMTMDQHAYAQIEARGQDISYGYQSSGYSGHTQNQQGSVMDKLDELLSAVRDIDCD